MEETTKQSAAEIRKPSDGFPSTILARFARSHAAITIDGPLTNNGDIKFSIPMKSVGLSRAIWSSTPAVQTAFFVDLFGEILVRKNIATFAGILGSVDLAFYDRKVNGMSHRHFGLIIDENDVLRFQFHASLVQRILVEDLEQVFGG